MTAIMTSQFFSPVSTSGSTDSKAIWQADIYDFDNEICSVEVEAIDKEEAMSLAYNAAADLGIDPNYILVYRF